MTENKPLKFGSGPSTTLTLADDAGDLAATVRYADEKNIEKGDTLDVLSAHTGDKIGVAEVRYTKTVEVRRALDVITMRWALYGPETTEELIKRLNDYYDGPIDATTEVKVIIVDPDMGA